MPEKKTRIVVLQRGWVLVGHFSQSGEDCTLENAAVIRRWGTTKGLGELAMEGPRKETVLDPAPTTHFHALTVICSIECNEASWSGKVRA